MEAQFWKRLGLTAEAVDRMPWKKVQQYTTYIDLLIRREELEAKKQGG